MESQARYTAVGVAVVLLTLLIVAAVLWLSEVGTLRNAKYYSIYFREHNLHGLQVDGYVTMRGIKVGSVVSLDISPKNIEQVRVVIMLNKDVPVKTNTGAIINRNLVTGLASIELAKGTQDAEDLWQIAAGESYPIIPEIQSQLDQLADSVPELLQKVSAMTERVHAMLSEENVQSVSASIKNVEDVTAAFAANKEEISKALKSIDKAAAEFSKATKALNDLASSSKGRVDAIGDGVSASLAEMQAALASFKTSSGELLNNLSTVSLSMSQQLSALVQSLSAAAKTSSSAFEAFEQPKKIIAGPRAADLGPGEKR